MPSVGRHGACIGSGAPSVGHGPPYRRMSDDGRTARWRCRIGATALQAVAKLRPRCERPFHTSSTLQNLERPVVFLQSCALTWREIARPRQRLTFTTAC